MEGPFPETPGSFWNISVPALPQSLIASSRMWRFTDGDHAMQKALKSGGVSNIYPHTFRGHQPLHGLTSSKQRWKSSSEGLGACSLTHPARYPVIEPSPRMLPPHSLSWGLQTALSEISVLCQQKNKMFTFKSRENIHPRHSSWGQRKE